MKLNFHLRDKCQKEFKMVDGMGIEPTTCRDDRSPNNPIKKEATLANVTPLQANGGRHGDRTHDLHVANVALSQLS